MRSINQTSNAQAIHVVNQLSLRNPGVCRAAWGKTNCPLRWSALSFPQTGDKVARAVKPGAGAAQKTN